MDNSTFTRKMNNEINKKSEEFDKLLQNLESPRHKNRKTNEQNITQCDEQIKLLSYKLTRIVSSGTDHFIKLKVSKIPELKLLMPGEE